MTSSTLSTMMPMGKPRVLHDDDAGVLVLALGLEAEFLAKVDDGHEPAAEVQDAFDVGRRLGDLGDLDHGGDFLDAHGLDAIFLAHGVKHQVLILFDPFAIGLVGGAFAEIRCREILSPSFDLWSRPRKPGACGKAFKTATGVLPGSGQFHGRTRRLRLNPNRRVTTLPCRSFPPPGVPRPSAFGLPSLPALARPPLPRS